MKVIYRECAGHTGFWIRDALGMFVFFVTHDRKLAQKECDNLFGNGKYTVNARGGK